MVITTAANGFAARRATSAAVGRTPALAAARILCDVEERVSKVFSTETRSKMVITTAANSLAASGAAGRAQGRAPALGAARVV